MLLWKMTIFIADMQTFLVLNAISCIVTSGHLDPDFSCKVKYE